jgi:hypothetical protein
VSASLIRGPLFQRAGTLSALSIRDVADHLRRHHYLGPASRGFALMDSFGVLVLANPTSRRLPQKRWLELVRWCLNGQRNGGSQQWAAVVRWLKTELPEITTVVSYSDPSVGHTGTLYRACNWRWAPTWHRLRPPPSGNGQWAAGITQSVKDRWIYPLLRDKEREVILRINDDALQAKHLHVEYRDK